MKINILYTLLIALSLAFVSCKKESTPGIVGQWRMTAVYTNSNNGSYEWVTALRFPEHITFNSDSRFSSFSDVPGGSGTYFFNRSTNDLQLNFEGGNNGSSVGSALLKVESLSADKLITVFISGNGTVRKEEFARIN